jgi:hypothetical protein
MREYHIPAALGTFVEKPATPVVPVCDKCVKNIIRNVPKFAIPLHPIKRSDLDTGLAQMFLESSLLMTNTPRSNSMPSNVLLWL